MVRQFIRNSTQVLFRRQTTIVSAAVIMMFLVLASIVLGLIRNRFLAHYFPIDQIGAYKASFVVPDLLSSILITGMLSVAFIPVFTTYLNNKQEKEAWNIADSVVNISLLFYLSLAIGIFIFIRPITETFVVPGFSPEKVALTTNLARVILIAQIFLIIGSFFTSVLQSFHRFIIPAIAPVLYNVGIIIGILWLRPFFGFIGVAWGVLIGAFFFMLIQFLLVKKFGFKYKFELRLRDKGVIDIIKLSLPRAIGVGLARVEWWVSIFLSSLLVAGSANTGIFGFAADIQNFPISLFGVTFATAALPMLSAEWATNKLEHFKATFLTTLHQVIYLTVPLSILLMTLRIPIVRIIYGSGFFDWDATVATAVTTSYFAIGIFAQSGVLLLIRTFYALHDAATPLKVAVGSLIFHVTISSFLVFFVAPKVLIPVALLGLSASFTGIFSFFILLYLLHRKVGGFDKHKLFVPAGKIFFSAAAMGLLLYIPLHVKIGGTYVIDYIIDTTRVFNLLILTAAALILGLAIYVALTWWLKSEELKNFLKLLPDIRRLQKFLIIQEKFDASNPK
ncbi:MAG: murein biosynthesis integral membrane protein MurJ [Candidatus Woykebacteria bacterium]